MTRAGAAIAAVTHAAAAVGVDERRAVARKGEAAGLRLLVLFRQVKLRKTVHWFVD